MMMVQFINWWTRDQESIRRDRFVNKIMQYAISSDSSDKSIKSILSLLGEELGAGRVIIFEDKNNGKYHGAYDWYAKGRDPGAVELLYLPYQGFIDDLTKKFRENNNRLIVENVDDYRIENFELFKILKTNHVKNMVARALEINERLLGILVMVDIPKAKFAEASGIIDIASSFGYLLCMIKGLEVANDAHGYDTGDKMIIDVTSYLMDVFGKTNVYRISGAQFVAFGFESDEMSFNNDVDRFKKLVDNSGIKVDVGPVYCMYGTKDISLVINQANELLQGS